MDPTGVAVHAPFSGSANVEILDTTRLASDWYGLTRECPSHVTIRRSIAPRSPANRLAKTTKPRRRDAHRSAAASGRFTGSLSGGASRACVRHAHRSSCVHQTLSQVTAANRLASHQSTRRHYTRHAGRRCRTGELAKVTRLGRQVTPAQSRLENEPDAGQRQAIQSRQAGRVLLALDLHGGNGQGMPRVRESAPRASLRTTSINHPDSGRESPIHIQASAGDKTRFRPRQIRHHARNLIGMAMTGNAIIPCSDAAASASSGFMSVSTGPGCTLFTVIPFGPRSRAIPCTNLFRADLLIAYTAPLANGMLRAATTLPSRYRWDPAPRPTAPAR